MASTSITLKRPPLFPIKTIDWHAERLRELDDQGLDPEDLEAKTLIMWHVIATGFLEYGSYKGFDGPATEVVIDMPEGKRRLVARKIKPFLRLVKGPKGHPRFEPQF